MAPGDIATGICHGFYTMAIGMWLLDYGAWNMASRKGGAVYRETGAHALVTMCAIVYDA